MGKDCCDWFNVTVMGILFIGGLASLWAKYRNRSISIECVYESVVCHCRYVGLQLSCRRTLPLAALKSWTMLPFITSRVLCNVIFHYRTNEMNSTALTSHAATIDARLLPSLLYLLWLLVQGDWLVVRLMFF